jgi:hypothetical protein
MHGFARWASIALAVLVAGCSSTTTLPQKLACPSVDLVPSLTRVAQFKPGAGRDPADVQIGAEMTGITRQCHHDAKGIGVDVRVSMTAIRSNPEVPRTKLTYFVAVVDGQRNILQEQDFDVDVAFLPAQAYRLYTDPVTVHIPTRDPAHTDDHILVGFRLSRDQLDFNRAHTGKK